MFFLHYAAVKKNIDGLPKMKKKIKNKNIYKNVNNKITNQIKIRNSNIKNSHDF